MDREVMNLKELCAYLKLSEKEVARRMDSSGLPAHRMGGVLRFRKIEVDDWLQRNMQDLSGEHLNKLEGGHDREEEAPGTRRLVTPLFRVEACNTCLAARTKTSLLRELTNLADSTGLVYDRESLSQALREREDLCSTGLEDGVAIPHPRVRQDWVLEESFLVIAVTPSGLPFGAPDGGLTDTFFMPLCQSDQEHLQVLARLCRMLQGDDFLQGIRDAESPSEVGDWIRTREEQVVNEWKKGRA